MIQITPSIAIDERSVTETFVRASGPGGQNVNKVSSAVRLRFDPSSSGLSPVLQARVQRLAGKRLTQQGTILITAQQHRTQDRNRQAALDALIRLIQRAAVPQAKRLATKPPAASRRLRLQSKSHRAGVKRTRAAPEVEA